MLRSNSRSVLAVLAAIVVGTANADTLTDEGTVGDFSNDGLVPTILAVGVGHNVVAGTTGNPGTGVDRDYFSFTVPAGAILSALYVLPNTSVSGSSSFIGLQAGSQLTVAPNGSGAQNLIGYSHYGADQIGTDLLPFLGVTSLASGAYSVWVQELGGVVPYEFDFVVTAVPVPAAGVLLLSGLAALGGLGRSRHAMKSIGGRVS